MPVREAEAEAQRLGGSTKLEPGSSVSVELIRGDLSWSANGTVTWVDGNKVYACRPSNLAAGPTDVPMSAGYVISLLQEHAEFLQIGGAARSRRSIPAGSFDGIGD
jgi:hypothetical protein